MFLDLKEIYLNTSGSYYWVSNNLDWDSAMYPIKSSYNAPTKGIEELHWKAIYTTIRVEQYTVVYINNFPLNYYEKNKRLLN